MEVKFKKNKLFNHSHVEKKHFGIGRQEQFNKRNQVKLYLLVYAKEIN
jgi:hypothetical protein